MPGTYWSFPHGQVRGRVEAGDAEAERVLSLTRQLAASHLAQGQLAAEAAAAQKRADGAAAASAALQQTVQARPAFLPSTRLGLLPLNYITLGSILCRQNPCHCLAKIRTHAYIVQARLLKESDKSGRSDGRILLQIKATCKR